jgi:hypothetical protein
MFIDAWYSGINNIMYVANCVDICWALKKVFPIFWMQMFIWIWISLQLIIMAFNFFVMDFHILLNKMYNN